MESVAEEWLQTLQERRDECIETLEREQMRYEVVFRVVRDGRLYSSWFSVQGEHGADVASSPHDIDKIHVEYWRRCVDRTFEPEDHEHVVTFSPPEVRRAVIGN